MILEKFPEVQRLSPTEKLQFVSELWNDLEAHPPQNPVDPKVIDELNRRIEHFHKNPQDFTTWEQIKNRIVASKA
jgi:putative addiction module component (TIGR02574 family)